jgi:hypothetical protein
MGIRAAIRDCLRRCRDLRDRRTTTHQCVATSRLFLAAAVVLVSCRPTVETSLHHQRALPSGVANYNYIYGTVIKCGARGNSTGYRGYGWSGIEQDFTWSDGRSAQVNLTVLPPAKPLRLRMRLMGVSHPPELPFQPVEVYANGERVATWKVGERADYTADIPTSVIEKGGDLTIDLRIPKAVSPKSLGISPDPRLLGVCCWEYDLSEV